MFSIGMNWSQSQRNMILSLYASDTLSFRDIHWIDFKQIVRLNSKHLPIHYLPLLYNIWQHDAVVSSAIHYNFIAYHNYEGQQ